VSVPNEASQHTPTTSSSIHKELEKVKFLEFQGATNGLDSEAWLENMEMFFALCDYT
jgi:hypothetical protein